MITKRVKGRFKPRQSDIRTFILTSMLQLDHFVNKGRECLTYSRSFGSYVGLVETYMCLLREREVEVGGHTGLDSMSEE